VMQELPELTGPAGERLQGLEAVNDNHSGAAFPEKGPDLVGDPRQAVAVDGQPEILVEDRSAYLRTVGENPGLAEAQDLLQRFGDRGQVDSRAVRAGVPEDVLLGDDRLACPRQPGDKGDAVGGQASPQHLVEIVVPAAEPAGHGTGT